MPARSIKEILAIDGAAGPALVAVATRKYGEIWGGPCFNGSRVLSHRPNAPSSYTETTENTRAGEKAVHRRQQDGNAAARKKLASSVNKHARGTATAMVYPRKQQKSQASADMCSQNSPSSAPPASQLQNNQQMLTLPHPEAHSGSLTSAALAHEAEDCCALYDLVEQPPLDAYFPWVLDPNDEDIVYYRHSAAERTRWRDCLRQLSSVSTGDSFNETSVTLATCAPPKVLSFDNPPSSPYHHANKHLPNERLAFSSCFESGNLALAKCDDESTYTLVLERDTNTQGYTNWFYFAVRGSQNKGQRATFKIVNMAKASPMFTDYGMRPVVWSDKGGTGWDRGCFDISFHENDVPQPTRNVGERGKNYFTLSFSYEFEHDDDLVFFAYHYPYTHSHLQSFLTWMSTHPYARNFTTHGSLCKTEGNLNCDYLTIGEPCAADLSPKPLAVVTARVHPGESNSSWIMHGFIRFLCSPTLEARALRKACSWMVVPMLNPDGVVHGNYRCGLAGVDLNRQFLNPDPSLHPTVWHLVEHIRGRRVDAYIDFHGHSKQEGIFFYGGSYSDDARKNAMVQLLPKLCTLASSDFKTELCKFGVQPRKLKTARLVAFLELGVLRSYTVEASYAGATRQDCEHAVFHDFSPGRLVLAGPILGKALGVVWRQASSGNEGLPCHVWPTQGSSAPANAVLRNEDTAPTSSKSHCGSSTQTECLAFDVGFWDPLISFEDLVPERAKEELHHLMAIARGDISQERHSTSPCNQETTNDGNSSEIALHMRPNNDDLIDDSGSGSESDPSDDEHPAPVQQLLRAKFSKFQQRRSKLELDTHGSRPDSGGLDVDIQDVGLDDSGPSCVVAPRAKVAFGTSLALASSTGLAQLRRRRPSSAPMSKASGASAEKIVSNKLFDFSETRLDNAPAIFGDADTHVTTTQWHSNAMFARNGKATPTSRNNAFVRESSHNSNTLVSENTTEPQSGLVHGEASTSSRDLPMQSRPNGGPGTDVTLLEEMSSKWNDSIVQSHLNEQSRRSIARERGYRPCKNCSVAWRMRQTAPESVTQIAKVNQQSQRSSVLPKGILVRDFRICQSQAGPACSVQGTTLRSMSSPQLVPHGVVTPSLRDARAVQVRNLRHSSMS